MPKGERPADGGRDRRGRFAAGNIARLTHGARSLRVAAELFPEQAAPLREREQRIVTDLGGDVSTVQRELITRFVQASAIADSLAVDIVSAGVLTGKGRTRASVTTFLHVLDRVHRLAVAVGLERRQKPTAGIREWAEQAGKGRA